MVLLTLPATVAGGRPQRRLQDGPEEREEIRARLLAAVAKAAGEQGYEQVTVDRVARYAGVADVAFFQHCSRARRTSCGGSSPNWSS